MDRVLALNNAIRTGLAVVSCVAVTVSTVSFFKIRNLSASADAAERAGDFSTAFAMLAAMDTWVSRAEWMTVLAVAASAVTFHCLLISRWISRSRVHLEAPTQHLDGGPAAGGQRLPVVAEGTPT